MSEQFLYTKLENLNEAGNLQEVPDVIKNNLSENIELREYQELAFSHFVTYFENNKLKKNKQVHTLFHMATGSGKTVIMAGLILYLYTKGYNKFLFFVNQTNILEKTKDNFINHLSSKYLFNKNINYQGNNLKINIVDNFSSLILENDIEICFTTTQKLHTDLLSSKENSLTYNDFEENKIVFISDESHHINTLTKKDSRSKTDEETSWEYTITNAFRKNKDSIMLEFTATVNLKDTNVEEKYKDKLIFEYPLKKFRESGYTKDFKNFATESELWDRALMSLIISEYRKSLFTDLKLNIKPVIMFKSKTITESKEFYNIFFDKIENLSISELEKFYNNNMQYDKEDSILDTKQLMTKILNYFKNKDISETLQLLLSSIKTSFTKETSIIMNGATDNNKENQLLVNSLEDKDNNIRLIFAVDMLNEGWDVLNLFDIVRLYDNKTNKDYTTKEAQLIGRGARYCPFKLDDEKDKFKRKYDNDLNSDYRILETMLFYSQNDSKYIEELRQALIESGLEEEKRTELDYILKDEFKETDFYKKYYVYSNERKPKSREYVKSVEKNFINKSISYTTKNNQGTIYDFDDKTIKADYKEEIKSLKFKEIDYNILLGSAERYSAFKFNVIKNKYPNVKTMREFLTSEDYLGNMTLNIYYTNQLKGKDIFNACVHGFDKISSYITSIKDEFEGTKEFYPKPIKDVIKDKKIYIIPVKEAEGKGHSQNTCSNKDYVLDLVQKEWYVFNDNYGTSEEKAFIRYFSTNIAPKLEEKNLEFYIIRNERISDLAIYDFINGERFEPDFLLFIKKKDCDTFSINQIYAEPKGAHLIENDQWKEEFLKTLKDKVIISEKYMDGNKYNIIGLPFFTDSDINNKDSQFKLAIEDLINKM